MLVIAAISVSPSGSPFVESEIDEENDDHQKKKKPKKKGKKNGGVETFSGRLIGADWTERKENERERVRASGCPGRYRRPRRSSLLHIRRPNRLWQKAFRFLPRLLLRHRHHHLLLLLLFDLRCVPVQPKVCWPFSFGRFFFSFFFKFSLVVERTLR